MDLGTPIGMTTEETITDPMIGKTITDKKIGETATDMTIGEITIGKTIEGTIKQSKLCKKQLPTKI